MLANRPARLRFSGDKSIRVGPSYPALAASDEGLRVMRTRWTVSQIGARQHYGVARGFVQTGNLNRLYTDLWSRWGHGLLRHGNMKLRAFAGRYHPSIPSDRVVSFNLRTAGGVLSSLGQGESLEQVYRNFLKTGAGFAAAVAGDLRHEPLDPDLDVFFGFNTGCLETFEMLGQRGIPTICDQIDPAAVEEQIVQEEMRRWPGWEKSSGLIPQEYWDRLQREWARASMVMVNSRWSRDALIRQGVPAEKLFILPIAYEPDGVAPVRIDKPQGELTVLWLGTVMLRKGIQYLLEAARLLSKEQRRVRILVVGQMLLTPEALATAPPNVEFLPRQTRDETARFYQQADVFVLPTLSDGFAITQLEAMAQGLPVITTRCCGEVVTSGVDGLIVPPRDGAALAAAIARLDDDRTLLRNMSTRAVKTSTQFRLASRARRLEEIVLNFRAGRPLQAPTTAVA